MPSDKTRFGLDETQDPGGLVQHHARTSRTRRRRPRRSRPTAPSSAPDQIGEVHDEALPDGVPQAGDVAGPLDRHPRRGHRRLQDVPPVAAAARAAAREGPRPARRACKIFYKYEGVSPAGSHKPNTAIPQAYYNKQEGITKISTETGAGQWGSALSIAGALYGIDIEVFMVGVSYDQKPYRRILMETYGGTVHTSPSNLTDAGRHVLAMDPDSTGSLGIAISEAVEVADEERRHALRARLGAQPRVPAPDDHRPRGHRADGARRGRARRRHRVRRRRLATSPASRSRTTTASSRARATRACSRSSRRRARR